MSNSDDTTVIAAPRTRIADTATPRGRGVFAAQSFRRGECVETSPVVVLDAPFAQLPFVLQRMVFSWCTSVGAAKHALALGYGSLYNNANPANLRYEREETHGVIRFVAVRDIAAGEELTINYSAADGNAVFPGDPWFDEHGIRLSTEPAR